MTKDANQFLFVGDKYSYQWQGRKNDLTLFASLGAAVSEVQSFETHLLAVLGIIGNQKDENNFYDKTMGVLIKTLSKSFPDSQISNLLEEIRDKRNRLIHSFLREYQWPIMSDDDYNRAILDLESTRSIIEKANLELSKYLSDRSLVNVIVLQIDHESGEINRVT